MNVEWGQHSLPCVCLQTGQMVDGPQYGASPPPWDVPVSLPQRYTDRVDKVVVPHSSFVKVQLFFLLFNTVCFLDLLFFVSLG